MNSKISIVIKIKLLNNRLNLLSIHKNEVEKSIKNLNEYLEHMKTKIGSIEWRFTRSRMYEDESQEVRYSAWINIYKYLRNDYENIATNEFKIDNTTVGFERKESKNIYTLGEIHKDAKKWLQIWEDTRTVLNEENELIDKEINANKTKKIELNKALLDLDLPKDPNTQKLEENEDVKTKSKKNDCEWGDQKQIILEILKILNIEKGKPFTKKLALKIQEEIKTNKNIEISLGNIKKVARDNGYKGKNLSKYI